jgi:hypothetical protein
LENILLVPQNTKQGRARGQIRIIHCFDCVKKNQVTQERLYAEDGERGRTSKIMKQVSGQEKKKTTHTHTHTHTHTERN